MFLQSLRVVICRGGVLEDTFWSPWPWPRRSSPWPRGLKSSKIGLSSARGQHYFLNRLKFCWKAPETSKKIWEDFFLFSSSGNCLKKKFWRPFSPEKKFWRPFFWDCVKNFFWKPSFFGEHLRLCPWSLALVSRGSVLGLEIFLCPWLWPRALCPRLHLWLYHTSTRHPLFLLKLYFTMKHLLSIYHCPHFLSILHIDPDISLHEHCLDRIVFRVLSLLFLISISLAL